jgi:hypothetical protein
MSTYQMVMRNTATAFRGVSLGAMYERFLVWWVSLYATAPRNPQRMI